MGFTRASIQDSITHQANTATCGSAQLQGRACTLHLMGLLAHWPLVQADPARLGWTGELLGWEESERARRRLESRLRSAHIGRSIRR